MQETPGGIEMPAPLESGGSPATPRDWQVVYEGDEPPAPAAPLVERRKPQGLWSRILSWIGGDSGRPGHRVRDGALSAPIEHEVAAASEAAAIPAAPEVAAMAIPSAGVREEEAAPLEHDLSALPEVIPPTPEPLSLAAASAAPGHSPDADHLLAELAASSLSHPLERGRSGEFMLPPDEPTFIGPDWLQGIRPDADLRVDDAEIAPPSSRPGGPPPLPPSRLASPAARPASSPARPVAAAAPAVRSAVASAGAPAVPTAPARPASQPVATPAPTATMSQTVRPPATVAPPLAPAAAAPTAPTAPIVPVPAPASAAPSAPPVPRGAPPAPQVMPVASEPSWIEPAPEPASAESAPSGPRERAPIRPRWPVPDFESAQSPWWSKPWVWAVVVAVLFAGGWLLGGMSNEREPGESSALSRSLRAIGLGGARYDVAVTSRPVGAWIAVDGKDLARRTPAAVELPPGKHQVTLSFSDLGGASFEVQGARGDRVSLDGALWGSLVVYAGDSGIPVAVAVDGVDRGLAPVTVDSLMPGAHDIRFSGPGLSPWGQTAQIRVREEAQLVARPITSPATGVIEVHATWTDAEGSEDLTGATVYLDGEKRGVTPLTLELPRGPHSVRVESRGESAPVQVIDLPGGNQRFANFELGLGNDRPTMQLVGGPPKVGLDEPSTVSAVVQGLTSSEVREMWLHVRQPDGTWRRYQMMMMKASNGVVGVAVFPNTLLDSHGQTLFYCSATSQMGDDSFTEVLAAVEVPVKK
jgi:hypothetical protein